jgi:hypothetical protein
LEINEDEMRYAAITGRNYRVLFVQLCAIQRGDAST